MGADNSVARLVEIAETLGDDEREVLVLLADRLRLGFRAYGRLNIDRDERDWTNELMAEILDGEVYAAIAIIKARRRKS